MNSSEMIVETRPVGPLQCNCTILGDPESRKAIIVDPGGDSELLLQRLVALLTSRVSDVARFDTVRYLLEDASPPTSGVSRLRGRQQKTGTTTRTTKKF